MRKETIRAGQVWPWEPPVKPKAALVQKGHKHEDAKKERCAILNPDPLFERIEFPQVKEDRREYEEHAC